MHFVVAPDSSTIAMSYDANGNLSYKLSYGQADVFTFDAENHLTQIKRNGATLESYTYDVGGNRVKKTVGSTSFYYPFAHYEISGTTVVKYYAFNGQRVAMKVGGTLTYLHSGHLGSTVMETNASGAVTTDERYFAGVYPGKGQTERHRQGRHISSSRCCRQYRCQCYISGNQTV